MIKIPNADSLEPGKSGSDVLWIIIGARGAELRLTEESDTALSYDPKQVPEKLPELRWPFFA